MSVDALAAATARLVATQPTADDLLEMIAKPLDGETEAGDPFFVLNQDNVAAKLARWQLELPRVEPFYAMKCNPHPAMVDMLAELGTGMDCASRAEIAQALAAGVPAERIIYANPCKPVAHLKFAAANGVRMMTFDNEDELHKVAKVFPSAQLVLRLLVDDSHAVCRLGDKFGCHADEACTMLNAARDLGLDVIGVSFHVGSGSRSAAAFSMAVTLARRVFSMAEALGFNLTLLDIGGGFPGHDPAPVCFADIAAELRTALDMHFPASMGVRIIAEPGRYFVASSCALAVQVIARRTVAAGAGADQVRDSCYSSSDNSRPASPSSPHSADDETPAVSSQRSYMYYLSDGVYGSLNCLLYDHASVDPQLLRTQSGVETRMRKGSASSLDAPRGFFATAPPTHYKCSLWGPTCDGLDRLGTFELPELQVEDWLYFPNTGAYTMAAGSTFNGFSRARIFVKRDGQWVRPACSTLATDATEFR